MHQLSQEAIQEIDKIIAEAAKLPLLDAAFLLWRRKGQLDMLEGRPTEEEVRINRAMTMEQLSAKLRHDRDHAQDGPVFTHVKRAQPRSSDADIKRAIIEAVKFDDDCFRNFRWEGDFWDACVRAVALAAKKHPHYLDATYRDAHNRVAYYMK